MERHKTIFPGPSLSPADSPAPGPSAGSAAPGPDAPDATDSRWHSLCWSGGCCPSVQIDPDGSMTFLEDGVTVCLNPAASASTLEAIRSHATGRINACTFIHDNGKVELGGLTLPRQSAEKLMALSESASVQAREA